MHWLSGSLQAAGALVLGVGLFLALPLGVALLALGGLTVAGGVVLEVGHRPRQVPAPVVEHPSWIRGPQPSDASGR